MSSRAARLSSSDSTDHGRFIPGTLLLERYRIQGLLGRGGMGEVYRADDLKLGQQVALKFLPPDLAQDPDRLIRFHDEVRLARQVSHPNVCRVYDIGDVGGQPFLSMEYIDGEDLATLLRRIGRLPTDKALEIGRHLCAGLAAAHDRGVLHRDLKPANIMLDGRGRVRITDFGLASVIGSGDGPGVRAGTPIYMAPEQLDGEESTERSDIYALGLVLYELFTGKRAFQGDTLADLVRSRVESTPAPPSTLIEDLDPVVERVILRCLEKEPKQRPVSALAVAAALPGGDPLAMALAAGETPSPEMVAAGGETGGLSPGTVRACLASLLAGAVITVLVADHTSLLRRVPPPKSTEVLVDRSKELIRRIGYTEPPIGTAYGYGYHRSYLDHIQKSDPTPQRWDRLTGSQPTMMYLWYRQSPRRLEPANVAGIADLDDPPPLLPGNVSIMLTSSGDLWGFECVPPQVDETISSQDGGKTVPPDVGTTGGKTAPQNNERREPVDAGKTGDTTAPQVDKNTASHDGGKSAPSDSGTTDSTPPFDWTPLFTEAGLRVDAFERAIPRWVPPVFGDTRTAWEGVYPDAPQLRVHVEAATYRGRPVFFHVYWPWNRPLRTQPFKASAGEEAAGAIVLILIVGALVFGGLLARRNIRLGRIDRKGGFRLAACIFAASLIGGLCTATHIPTPGGEWGLLTRLCGRALFDGFVVWLYYIALEPLVRRRWPERIISWTRLLGGRLQDPMVGRDLLIGMAIGIGLAFAQSLPRLVPIWLGRASPMPEVRDLNLLLGPRLWVSGGMTALTETVGQSLVMLFILCLMRLVFRRQWMATLGFFVICWTFATLILWEIAGPWAAIVGILMGTLLTFVVGRFGVLALAASLFTDRLLTVFPIASALTSWYAGPGLFAMLVLAVLVVFGARAALAGRSILDVRLPQA